MGIRSPCFANLTAILLPQWCISRRPSVGQKTSRTTYVGSQAAQSRVPSFLILISRSNKQCSAREGVWLLTIFSIFGRGPRLVLRLVPLFMDSAAVDWANLQLKKNGSDYATMNHNDEKNATLSIFQDNLAPEMILLQAIFVSAYFCSSFRPSTWVVGPQAVDCLHT